MKALSAIQQAETSKIRQKRARAAARSSREALMGFSNRKDLGTQHLAQANNIYLPIDLEEVLCQYCHASGLEKSDSFASMNSLKLGHRSSREVPCTPTGRPFQNLTSLP